MSDGLLVFNDDAIADVVERLRADLNTWVATVNSNRGLTLHDVDVAPGAGGLLDYMPPLRELTRYPTIAVTEGASELVDDVGWAATGLTALSVVVIHQHADAGVLAHELRGYRMAVGNCVLALRHLSHVWGVVFRGSVPGPTLAASSPEGVKEWLSLTGLAFELRDEQG